MAEDENMLASNLKIHITQVALPRYFGEDFRTRVEYRAKFIERNEKFQNFENELMDFDFEKRGNKKVYNRLLALGKSLFPEDPILAAGILRVPHERLAEELALQSMASIEVLSEKGKASKSRYLEYHELDDYWKMRLKTQNKVLMPRITDSVDCEDNTIKVKIHLDRQIEDIIRDVNYLINLVDREAKHLRKDRRKPKRPQWDVYDKYLRVYDLRRTNPKMQWSEIAKRLFPNEIEKNHKAPWRKTRKKELASNSAVNKVYRFWKEADKMINKGGWRQI